MVTLFLLLLGAAQIQGTQIRLAGWKNSPGNNRGRVEVYYSYRWGTICDDGWDNSDAIVACRMLGFRHGGVAKREAYFGQGSGPIWMDDVQCTSSESDIAYCRFNGWGSHNCGHSEDAGVICYISVDGQWSGWGQWTSCSVTCGRGNSQRSRSCSNPSPEHGGKECVGEDTENTTCKIQRCPETYDVRLIDGDGAYEGRIEVYHEQNTSVSGTWGTLCDDSFGKAEADVICRMLGYRFGGIARIGAYFGEGQDPILIDELQCNGTESGIANCTHSDWEVHNCDHNEDAGVTCYRGEWNQWTSCSTTCGEGTRMRHIVCHESVELCGRAVENDKCSLPPCAVDGIWTSWEQWSSCSVTCENGTNTRRRNCSNPAPAHGGKTCNGNGMQHRQCETGSNCPVEVRLVGSNFSNQGIVEVYYNRSWGTICDDNWDNDDANVICKMLDFNAGGTGISELLFGPGSGRIWMDDVECGSQELNISDCKHNGWGVHNCKHSEDASVLCYSKELEINVEVRLVGSNVTNRGRVEVFFMDQWGTICDNGWDDIDASIICKMLGYQNGGIAFTHSKFGIGEGRIWLDYVTCGKDDGNITECEHSGWGDISCSHLHDAGVLCLTSEIMNNVKVRLTGSDEPDRGRVEIFAAGEIGTLCDPTWNQYDAEVVCGMLGYKYEGIPINGSLFQQGLGRIWSTNTTCSQTNMTLSNCSYSLAGFADCSHDQDVGVWCNTMEDAEEKVKVHLVDGEEYDRGRLEVLFMDKWGSVCDIGFNEVTAQVICEMLGYGSQGIAFKGSVFGPGNGTIWLENLVCNTNDTSLSNCSHNGWGNTRCSHMHGAGIWCVSKIEAEKDVKIRLSGSNYPDRGRVEVLFMNKWGTVCNSGWDDNDASFVCRILGFENGGIGVSNVDFGRSESIIWIADVECSQDYTNFTDCYHSGWGNHSCDHSQDASVLCISEEGNICGVWGNWTECSVTCGNGTMTRFRRCKVPESLINEQVFDHLMTEKKGCTTNVPCTIDGNWGSWNSWSPCSKSCSSGIRRRSRNCDNPEPSGGYWCIGDSSEVEQCKIHIDCPVHGNWSAWSSWTTCSVTCENGTISRTRSCNNPSPAFGGEECEGNRTEEAICETSLHCPVNGDWGNWSEWSVCSASCEKGISTRSRKCNNPEAMYGGQLCTGNDQQAKECDTGVKCPINGNWSDWTSWTTCSVSCQNGTMTRARFCNNPIPLYGGDDCIGNENEVENCETSVQCPVNGDWGNWTEWSVCSATCGKGMRTRTRQCNNPIAEYGGQRCVGNDHQAEECKTGIKCPINGHWSNWTFWTVCSATCHNGTMTRSRSCNNPAPLYGGDDCIGEEIEVKNCDTSVQCPVNGDWGNWTEWSACSASCEKGMRTRMRQCNNPIAEYGGQWCVGNDRQAEECKTGIKCPINGHWSNWTSWTVCSVTCHNGTMTRSRSCNNPVPLYGGDDCIGEEIEVENCDTSVQCPVNGDWGNWTEWSACSASCEKGMRTRMRQCNNPIAEYGGQWCVGNDHQSEECSTGVKCPINGHWSNWTSWTVCSATCHNGTMTRSRSCNNPLPLYGGDDCIGEEIEVENCDTSVQCPVNGNWGYWNEWSACSASCEKGMRTRTRQCNDPRAEYGGQLCVGNDYQAEECSTGVKCPIDGNWSSWGSWTDCAVTCGTGKVSRTRKCDNPVPYFAGNWCIGQGKEIKNCNNVGCPVDGEWSVWSTWSECSVTCGNGSLTRMRKCDNPTPMNGGKQCNGTDEDSTECYTGIVCSVDGQWGSWNEWSDCSATCGCGSIERIRDCNNPAPKNGGLECNGTKIHVEECFMNDTCPDFCGEGHFLCQDGRTCITTSMSCDGVVQCPDGDDEIYCLGIWHS